MRARSLFHSAMGTRGYIVYRHNNLYFTSYNHLDSYPEALGVDTLARIPRDPQRFQQWLQHKRKECETILLQWYAGERNEDPRVTNKQPQCTDEIQWIYELDLDRLIFHVNAEPMFRLDRLPPAKIFVGSIVFDHYGNCACSLDTPEEFRCSVTPPPSVIGDGDTEAYRLHCIDVPHPIHEVLSRHESMSSREVVCVRALEMFVGFWMRRNWRHSIMSEMMPRDYDMHSDMEHTAKAFMSMLLHLVVCPAYYRTDMELNKTKIPHGKFWWVRKHICVRPSTHLTDARTLHLAISELLTEIMTTSEEQVVFGVAFSMFHCCIVRIDRRTRGLFKHTGVLPVLPSPWTDSSSTSGITALARLGDLPYSDDISHFLRLRSLYQRNSKEDFFEDNTSKLSSALPSGNRLPLEILMKVADRIDDADALNIFALSSKTTLSASLHRLKYPQLHGDKDCPSFFLCSAMTMTKEAIAVGCRCDSQRLYLYSGVFGTVVKGRHVIVSISANENVLEYVLPKEVWKFGRARRRSCLVPSSITVGSSIFPYRVDWGSSSSLNISSPSPSGGDDSDELQDSEDEDRDRIRGGGGIEEGR